MVIVKFFVYRYNDNKKANEQVEQSKTVWEESVKTEFIANCIHPVEPVDPKIDKQIYCECVAEKAQLAAAFPTAYNANEVTEDQYQAELERLSDAYFDSELGRKDTEECVLAAQAK